MSATAGRVALGAAVLAILGYLIFPVIVVVAISFSSGNFLVFPPPGLSLRWYHSIASDPEWVSALWVTLNPILPPALVICRSLPTGGRG